MNPVLFKIGRVAIYWYGALMALAFVSGVFNCMYLARKRERSAALVSDLVFWMVIGGLIGARLAYVLANPHEYARNLLSVLFFFEGGLVFYGGVIGGVVAILVFARVKRERALVLLDIVAVAAPLGHALGRIGCFINGCCYGTEYSGALAVAAPGIETGLSRTTVHAVQLYESGANILVYIVLMWFFHRKSRSGTVAGTYLAAYSIIRFTTEFFRGDPRLMVLGLTAAQVTSIVLLGVAVVGLVWVQISGRRQTDSGS